MLLLENSLGPKRSVHFSKGTQSPVTKFGKERVHRRELFRSVNLTSVVLMLQNSRTELRKKPCNKKDAPVEMHVKWRNMSISSKISTKPRSTGLQKFGWSLPAPSSKKPEERQSVVNSRASMHMLSRKDLISAELETVRVSRTPTTVVTANGAVQTNEKATENVHDLSYS